MFADGAAFHLIVSACRENLAGVVTVSYGSLGLDDEVLFMVATPVLTQI